MFIVIERLCDNGLTEEVLMLDRHYPRRAWERLSLMELAAAKFICDGLADGAVAERLNLSEAAARGVIETMFAKLGVASRVELVIQAVERHSVT